MYLLVFAAIASACIAGVIWQERRIRKLRASNRRLALMLAGATRPCAPPSRRDPVQDAANCARVTASLVELVNSTAEAPQSENRLSP